MLLTTELAQPIVQRAMAILNRNVNIMDAHGIIVGSGDPKRIGTFHQGAARVIRTGHRVEIHPEDQDRWEGVRPGVNLPVRLDGKTVGVVGITGHPEEVRPYGELLREMVQLMLVQARLAEVERTASLAREALIRELLTTEGTLPDRVVRQSRLVGLQPDGSHRVLLCQPVHLPEPGDYNWVDRVTARAEDEARALAIQPFLIAGPWEDRLILIAGEPAGAYPDRLMRELGPTLAVASGPATVGLEGLRESYRQACLALRVGLQLKQLGPYTPDGLYLEMFLATADPQDARHLCDRVLAAVPRKGTPQGDLIRATITAFAEAGMSVSGAAERLGIHRHTLMYRLEQIAREVGQDPREWKGLHRLTLAIMVEQLFRQNVPT